MVPTGMLPDQEADKLKGTQLLAPTAWGRKATTWQESRREWGAGGGMGTKSQAR